MQTSEISYVATSQFASPLRPTFRSETANWRQQLAGTYAIVHGRKEPQEPIWISYRSKWRWSPEYCGYSSQCILSFFRLLVEVLRLMNRNFEDSDNYHECWCSTPWQWQIEAFAVSSPGTTSSLSSNTSHTLISQSSRSLAFVLKLIFLPVVAFGVPHYIVFVCTTLSHWCFQTVCALWSCWLYCTKFIESLDIGLCLHCGQVQLNLFQATCPVFCHLRSRNCNRQFTKAEQC